MAEHAKPRQIVLLRHGETEWAKSGQHTGLTDIPLTEHGMEQATCLRDAIRKWKFERVFSSPLSRAKETARLAGLIDIEVCPELAEFNYGDYEGLTSKQICESVPGFTVWTHPCPNGETLEQAAARIRKLMDEEIRATTGDIAIVAHGHILRIFVCVYLGISPDHGKHFMLDPCSVCILTTEHDFPSIKLWNGSLAAPQH